METVQPGVTTNGATSTPALAMPKAPNQTTLQAHLMLILTPLVVVQVKMLIQQHQSPPVAIRDSPDAYAMIRA